MNNPKILVVDDEKNLLLVLQTLLTNQGYSVFAASRGKDALIMAKSKRPDLIILDIMLPDMHGPKVAEELKEDIDTKDIPILFLTALLTKKEEGEKKRFAGNNVVIAKPFDTNQLLNEIEKLLPEPIQRRG